VVILSAMARWRPFTSGVPIRYRAERQRAIHEIWIEQTETARTRLAELTSGLRDDATVIDAQCVWGDPVSEAHRLARALSVSRIVFPVPAGRRFHSIWPVSVEQRLTRNAPCPILLAPAVREPAAMPTRQKVPTA
jgi:hypothetical protein